MSLDWSAVLLVRLVLFLGRSKVLFLVSEVEEDECRLFFEVVLTGGVGTGGAKFFILGKDPLLHLYSPDVLLDSELVLLFSEKLANTCSSPRDRELFLDAGGVTPGLLFKCSLLGVITVNSSLFLFFLFFIFAFCNFVKGDSG